MPRSRSRKKFKRIKRRFSGEKETVDDTCELDTCKGSEDVVVGTSQSGLKSRNKRKKRSRSLRHKRLTS